MQIILHVLARRSARPNLCDLSDLRAIKLGYVCVRERKLMKNWEASFFSLNFYGLFYEAIDSLKIFLIFFLIDKAELLQEGIFFLIHLFARDVSIIKKLEIEKTQPTFIISVEYWVVLVSLISNFFTNKTSLAHKWMSLAAVIWL